MKIYIAGSISNDPNYEKKFESKEKELKLLGYEVLNPAKNCCKSYKEYIDAGLSQLQQCDAIYLLSDYEKSKGALLEKHYAETVGIRILLEWGCFSNEQN